MPGITVAEARALVPNLTVGDTDPVEDAADLRHRLAIWCQRWTPRVAADREDGPFLDITGCDDLFRPNCTNLRAAARIQLLHCTQASCHSYSTG